jgi:Zn-dependent M32 family carboxypeptidase
MKKIQTVKTVEHPLEEFLDIERNSTQVIVNSRELDDSVIPIEYDEKDVELENEISEIQKEALGTYDALREQMDTITDSRQKARLAEVGNQLLGTALAAAEKKLKMKQEKEKNNKTSKSTNKVVNNTLIVGDRNDILKQVRNGLIDIENEEN